MPVSATDDPHPRPCRLDAEVDAPALARVEVGVGEQVADHLTDPLGIGQGEWQRRGDVDAERLVLGGDPRAHQLGNLPDGLADVDRARVDLDVVGLETGDVEQVVDEIDEPVGGALDDVQELQLARATCSRASARAARRSP